MVVGIALVASAAIIRPILGFGGGDTVRYIREFWKTPVWLPLILLLLLLLLLLL